MAVNPVDTLTPPVGMFTDFPPADVPKTHCQSATGFTPGRNGKIHIAPLLKRIQKSFGITIYGTAVWQAEHAVGDRLLLFTTTTVYSMLLSSNTFSDVAWKLDERIDGPHSYYSLPALVTVASGSFSLAVNGVYSIQFGQELIISLGGGLYRYYVDTGGLGTEHWYSLGVATGAAPTLSQTTGGSMTPSAVYSYEYTFEDELGRESSPSAATSITLSSSNNSVIVTRGSTTIAAAGGATYWNVYRLNDGGTVYKFVAQVAIATSTYTDTAADGTVNSGDDAPTDGENDPPYNVNGALFGGGSANILAVWKNRIVMNSSDDNRLQISNSNSPTQFSSLPLPTNLDDGLQVLLNGKGQNSLTGLANLGSLLAIFMHDTTILLYGDDISSFTLRETLQRGCLNPNSVQRCENEVYFLSDDGIYAIGYEDGYAVTKRSVPIDNLFRGWTWLKQRNNPTSKWRYQPFEAASAITPYVNSFYTDNRYYISFANRTLCMDVRTGGWTDTGWGFVKTATRYYAQQSVYVSGFNLTSGPETIFLTFGDPTTWDTQLYYFTSADTPSDRDAPGHAASEIVYRPIGADPTVQTKRRRVTWLSQYGTTSAKRGEVIGTICWTVDGNILPTNPIYAYITSNRTDALFEVSGPKVAGNVIFPTMRFTKNDLALQNGVAELVYLN